MKRMISDNICFYNGLFTSFRVTNKVYGSSVFVTLNKQSKVEKSYPFSVIFS